MKRSLVLCVCAACLWTARAPAATPAAVREAEQDAANAVRHGDYPTAVKLYEDCLTQTPNDPRLLSNLGAAYYQNGQTDAALKTLRRAVGLAPQEGFAYHTLGIVQYWQKEDAEAVRSLESAVKFDGRDALAYKYLGLAYARLGDQRRASAASARARQLAPARRL